MYGAFKARSLELRDAKVKRVDGEQWSGSVNKVNSGQATPSTLTAVKAIIQQKTVDACDKPTLPGHDSP